MANAFWNFVLNKGWAGESLSREETIQRLNPLLRRHIELNHSYDYLIVHLDGDEASEQMGRFQKVARNDVGKVRETILSSGGVPHSGIDLEPDDIALDGGRDEMFDQLMEQEQALLDHIEEEQSLSGREHHMRTKAILENLHKNSQERLNFLKTQRKTQPTEVHERSANDS